MNCTFSSSVSESLTVQWGNHDDLPWSIGFFVTIIYHEPLTPGLREPAHATIKYVQNLSKEQRKHIEGRELSSLRPSGLQPLRGRAHQESIIRKYGVTVEMQDEAIAYRNKLMRPVSSQLTDEEVAHDDLLPEQWQGRCPWLEGC